MCKDDTQSKKAKRKRGRERENKNNKTTHSTPQRTMSHIPHPKRVTTLNEVWPVTMNSCSSYTSPKRKRTRWVLYHGRTTWEHYPPAGFKNNVQTCPCTMIDTPLPATKKCIKRRNEKSFTWSLHSDAMILHTPEGRQPYPS